ncbi:MAG: lysylphosphatidylglycerol synthase transmembrane domain-containing protein [Prevotella sp.]
METTKKIANTSAKILSSLFLGGAILYWMYRDFDFSQIKEVLLHGMDWTWMLLSFPFGILAQMIRGWRWRQALEPAGEHTRRSVAVNAIFLSYAASLVIPRIGEFTRCAVLKRYDDVSFSKALGTVVTERVIDTLLVMLITGLTLIFQIRIFDIFFARTGTRLDTFFTQFSTTGWIVTIICGIAAISIVWYMVSRLSVHSKIKDMVHDLFLGVSSLRQVNNAPLYVFWTLAIWVCYFLHYYLTFFCFDATSGLGLDCAIVTFIVGSIAVIVPTPNGAGPWHFAVKTMLILYGVNSTDALYFVLIVHSVQTLLVILLGIWGWAALSVTAKRQQAEYA